MEKATVKSGPHQQSFDFVIGNGSASSSPQSPSSTTSSALRGSRGHDRAQAHADFAVDACGKIPRVFKAISALAYKATAYDSLARGKMFSRAPAE